MSSYAAEISSVGEEEDDEGQLYLKVSPSEQKTVSWTFKNTGPNSWQAGEVSLIQVNQPNAGLECHRIIGLNLSVAPKESATFNVDFTSPELEGVYLLAYQLRSLEGQVLFGPLATIIIEVRADPLPENPIIEAIEEEFKNGDDNIPPVQPSGNAEGMKSVVASKFADLIKANYSKMVREIPQGQFNAEQVELLL